MSGKHRCVADLGAVRVAVVTDHEDLLGYLRNFYMLEPNRDYDTASGWTFEARLMEPDPDRALTPWRVGYRADRDSRQAIVCSADPNDLAITVRKAIREVLLDYCEARGYTMLHASAVADEDQVLIVVGDKGSGKTTLALDAALTRGFRYVSNDHLILYRTQDGLVATSLPTPIPVKVGTYFDYANWLGTPWDDEGVDLEGFRCMPRKHRYAQDIRLLYTYRSLGQDNPIHIRLDGRRVVVVLASYALDGQPANAPEPLPDPGAQLWPHVRFDWVFDPALNTRHLPRTERDRDAYARDGAQRLAELAAGSRVLRWRHRGNLAPLLDTLDDQLGGQP